MRSSLIVTAVLLLTVSSRVQADEDDSPAPARGHRPSRVLGGHAFQYPLLQKSAFLGTTFAFTQGAALYRLEADPDALFDLGVDRELYGATEQLDLALGFTPWMALELSGRGTATLGGGLRSLLVHGGRVSTDADGALAFRLYRAEGPGTQLTLRVGGGLASGEDLGLLPLLGAVIDTAGVTVGDVVDGRLGQYLVVPTHAVSVRAGLHLAQALGRMVSIQASLAADSSWLGEDHLVPGEDRRETETRNVFRGRGALALGLDFAPVHVPVALQGEYLFMTGNRDEARGQNSWLTISSVGLGLFYSGQDHLQLGVGASFSIGGERVRSRGPDGALTFSSEPTLSTGQLVFRYFW